MILIKKLVPFFVFAVCMINASVEDNHNSADAPSAVVLQEHVVATEPNAEKKVVDNSALDAAQQQEYVVNISCKEERNIYSELVPAAIIIVVGVLIPVSMFMYMEHSLESRPEWQLRNLQEQQKLAYEQAKQAFQKALWKSDSSSEKGAYNCPIESQDAARQFVECGGRSEMKEIVNRFYASMQ